MKDKDLGASADADRATGLRPQPAAQSSLSSVPSAARKVDQHFTAMGQDDYDFSPDAGMLRLTSHDGRYGKWWQGDFVDYRGIVTIQQELTFTRLDTVAGGRCHVRTWRRFFAPRTVIKLCRAFLTDLHGAPAQPSHSLHKGDGE